MVKRKKKSTVKRKKKTSYKPYIALKNYTPFIYMVVGVRLIHATDSQEAADLVARSYAGAKINEESVVILKRRGKL